MSSSITKITPESDVGLTLDGLATNEKHVLLVSSDDESSDSGERATQLTIWIFASLREADETLAYGKKFGNSATSLLLTFHDYLGPYREAIRSDEKVILVLERCMFAGLEDVAYDIVSLMDGWETVSLC